MPRDDTERALRTADLDDDLVARLRFVLEIDRLKEVERRSRISDGTRLENSAEHSWHLALMALVLAPHAAAPIDVGRVVAMVLVHDLVEIDAGDAFVYNESARADKARLEVAAAARLFAIPPGAEGAPLRALWDEYEAGESPEARFAYALDRLAPLMLNHATAGVAWHEHGISADRVYALNSRIERGAPELWNAARAVIASAVAEGYLAPAPVSDDTPVDTR